MSRAPSLPRSPALLELLAPSRCLSCRARGPVPWCAACAQHARPLAVGCSRCAAPGRSRHACWLAGAPVDRTVAVFDYRGPVADAVTRAKVHGARAAWPALGALLAARLAELGVDADAVTWVSTPPRRVRSRGLDHARLLAHHVGGALDLPVVRLLDVRASRTGAAYRARRRLPGTHLLLIDDVLTTGVTAWRAAAALVGAGAGRIELGVLARAGRHALGAAAPGRSPAATGGRARPRRQRLG